MEIVCERVRKFLHILENSDYEYVAAFSHFGFMKCMLRVVLGTAYNHRAVMADNCAIFVLEYDGNQWSIAALNYMKPID